MNRLLLALLLPVQLLAGQYFEWRQLPDLPDPLGTAGAFSGAAGGSLVVAGGSHFPVSPFDGGVKRWLDRTWILPGPGGEWRRGEPLPGPLAHGAAVTTPEGILLLGGSDGERHYPNVLRVRLENGVLSFAQLPAMPGATAFHAAAIAGDTVYVAGGQAEPDSGEALHTFWAARAEDLHDPRTLPVWRELEPWPGPARILAAAAGQDGSFYLMSGAELIETPEGRTSRRYLRDAYRYRPAEGWKKAAPLPRAAVAAPAAPWGASHIVLFGGDDGRYFGRNEELGDSHPGFTRQILAYHVITDTWTGAGEAPAGHAVTGAVPWQGGVVIPSGEDRPGHRSPQVYFGAPAASGSRFGAADYAALAIYLAALVALGAWFSRREKTTDNFFLAGRRIPWWAAGLSIYGTQLSSISFLAIPAKVYATDWAYLLLQLTIVLIAFPVVWIYLPFFRRVDLTTAYEYLELRFSLAVRLFASASFILFQLGRMAIVLFLPAIALATVTGIDVYACILTMGVLATLYTWMGGIEAVIWTDVVQVFVLLGGALASVVIILSQIDGGLGGLIALGAAHGKFHVFNWTWDHTTAAVWVVLVGNLFNNLVPYTADQAVVQRYLTTKDEKSAARGIWTNALLVIPSTLLLFTLGTGLWAFYRARPELLEPGLAGDAIFPLFIAQQLPAGLAGLVIAGVFAASMSTLDSSLNSVAAAIVTDFYGRLKSDAPDATKFRLARRLTIAFGALATLSSSLLASFGAASLWDAFQAAMGLFGGGLAGLFALGILTRRANARGALAGALASAAIVAWTQWFTDLHFFLYGMTGVVSAFALGYVISLAFPAPPNSLEGLTLAAAGRGPRPS